MLTQTQIEKFINGEVRISYRTIQGPRLEVTARFVRHGSEGWWMFKIEGDAKWSKEWISTAKARSWASSRDMVEIPVEQRLAA